VHVDSLQHVLAACCRYISFVEILSTKAVQGFVEAGFGEAQAQRYACFSFFAGLMATWLLGKAVSLIGSASKAWSKHRVGSSLFGVAPKPCGKPCVPL